MNPRDLTSIVPSSLREALPGIFYADRPFVSFDRGIVEFLKGRAGATASRRARVCAHPSAEADQHDMLIVSHRDTYVAPHRHLSKSESMLVLEGSASALLFSDDGASVQYLAVSAPGTERPFFYRMPARQYHSLAIETEFLVFVESTKGPFRPGDTEFAPWAPAASDAAAGLAFLAGLTGRETRGRARG
jgi:cupin fold WbuC family metalloprotein